MLLQSSFFGHCSRLQRQWWEQVHESAIIWFVIAARKGEKKPAALRRISRPIMDLQKKLHEAWKANDNEDKLPQPPQLIVDHFSFEELHAIMCRNRGHILWLFDEMSSFYRQLDLYKHLSTMDRKTLLTLNGGGSWARNYKSYSASMDLTSFNVTGFIQPAFVYEMLNLVPTQTALMTDSFLISLRSGSCIWTNSKCPWHLTLQICFRSFQQCTTTTRLVS